MSTIPVPATMQRVIHINGAANKHATRAQVLAVLARTTVHRVQRARGRRDITGMSDTGHHVRVSLRAKASVL